MGIFSIVMLLKHPFLQDCILFDINSHSSSDDFIHLFRWDSRAGTLVSKHLRCEDRAFFDVAGGDDRTSGVGAGRCLGVQTFQIIAATQGVDECNPHSGYFLHHPGPSRDSGRCPSVFCPM